MKKIKHPQMNQWAGLMKRPLAKQDELFSLVHEVFSDVEKHGDKAVAKYTLRFDKVALKNPRVTEKALKASLHKTPKTLQKAIGVAKRNIEKFHAVQKEKVEVVETTEGVQCWRESRPIERVGIYIPGGTAPLFSTVLMLGVPAKIAGCKEIILCTPPNKQGEIHPAILFAAQKVGVTHIFAVGGVQAIGAMTFGTKTIPKVDKIFGPGNQHVTAAKHVAQSFGVAIDMPAGPSELLIIADHSSEPEFVAADLLSQAEHGTDSQVVLLSNSEKVLDAVIIALKAQLSVLPRKKIAKQSLKHSKFILLDGMDACIGFSNRYAPEHLILAVKEHHRLIKKISNAGSVFLGNYSCESAGDYASGTNHTLPTNGHARNYSGVSLDSFVKKITFQELSAQGLKKLGPTIEIMAEAEQLMAHKNAVAVRLKGII